VREYTVGAVAAVIGVLAVELTWLRTGILGTRAYWWSMLICFGFMVAVDGWLTKLSAPIVLYDSHEIIGWRIPWDIPIEDYLFGFALLTLTMITWDALGRREQPRSHVAIHEPVR
jgi:lycopene cyclase domain-containing protein